jgi:nitroreductase
MTTLSPEQLLGALNWRYATKKFNAAAPISADLWKTLETALVLAPSSFGLQPWKFVVVTDPQVKAQLVPHSWGQSQPADCSHMVVFAVKTGLNQAHVDQFLSSHYGLPAPYSFWHPELPINPTFHAFGAPLLYRQQEPNLQRKLDARGHRARYLGPAEQ